LAGEWPAFFGSSWHAFVDHDYPGSKAVLAFADGHTGFIKIYWDGISDLDPGNYEPPPTGILHEDDR